MAEPRFKLRPARLPRAGEGELVGMPVGTKVNPHGEVRGMGREGEMSGVYKGSPDSGQRGSSLGALGQNSLSGFKRHQMCGCHKEPSPGTQWWLLDE